MVGGNSVIIVFYRIAIEEIRLRRKQKYTTSADNYSFLFSICKENSRWWRIQFEIASTTWNVMSTNIKNFK